MSEIPNRFRDEYGDADMLEVIRPDDVVIVILGTTGAGKSSFIANCTKDRIPRIGHELSSCTTHVSVHTMQMIGRTVHLIDTPGFNDTLRSDADTFQELAYWLAAADDRKIRLSGVIFLHRITDIRFHSSSRRAFELFKALCGQDAFCGAVVATTMWNRVAAGEIEKAQGRQAQLRTKIQEDVLAFGGRLVPIFAAEVDPFNVVRHIVRKNMRLELAFQKELRCDGCILHQTTAGKIVYENLLVSFEATRDSRYGPTQEMAAALASLRATRAEAQIAWEMRIEQENKDFEQLVQKYQERSRVKDCGLGASLPVQPATVISKSTESLPNSTAEGSGICSISYIELETELEELKRQHDAVMRRLPHKLDRRGWTHGRGTTTLGVVGTGLAVGQLVAAMACNVM